MNNSSFSISIHILTLLAGAGSEIVSSEYMAGSINVNPVLIRKELINLRKHGLIATKEGKNGGSYLNKPASQIRLSDVYDAVKQSSLLGRSKNTPNPSCQIGRQIGAHLDKLYDDAEKAMLKQLGSVTLEKFANRFV